jgi:FAD/FMN-containing dehydrogenase
VNRRAFLGGAAVAVLGGPLAAARGGPAATRLTAAQRRALRDAAHGPVFFPGGAGYDAARRVFNRRFDGVEPPAVVRARDTADVQAVVRWARRFDVALVARAGGHGYAGDSTSRSAVVVDVGGLDRISLSGTTATLGPGARNLRVYAALAARGRTVPAGSCPTVAVGGLVLGGGMGLAGRAYGLTLDRVASFDVVTADGRRRRVDAGHDPDLFWALRGGGGSFGIVTAIRLRTHAVPAASWFRVTYPRAARAEALAAYDALAPRAPRELTAIFTLDGGGGGASAFGQHLGSEAALRRLVAPLANVAGARLTSGSDGYLALQRRWAGCADGGLPACLRFRPTTFDAASVYVSKRLTGAGRGAFVAAADTGATLICDAYGGAINEVSARRTAFVHRDARFSVQILSYTDVATARGRVNRARRLIAPHGNGQAYQNYADLDQPGPLRAYYGENLERLRRVKRAADPDGRFGVL